MHCFSIIYFYFKSHWDKAKHKESEREGEREREREKEREREREKGRREGKRSRIAMCRQPSDFMFTHNSCHVRPASSTTQVTATQVTKHSGLRRLCWMCITTAML